MSGASFPIPHDTEFKWAAVDLDQTLAEGVWTSDDPLTDIGPPIEKNILKLWALVSAGYKPIIYSARPWDHYEGVEQWLSTYGVPYRRIVLGKLNPAVFIDDKAKNARDELWIPDW